MSDRQNSLEWETAVDKTVTNAKARWKEYEIQSTYVPP